MNQVIKDKEIFIAKLLHNIETVLRTDLDKNTEELTNRLTELQEELINHTKRGTTYDSVAEEIQKLQSQKQESEEYNFIRQNKRQRIFEIIEFLEQQDNLLMKYDEQLTRHLLEKIIIQEKAIIVIFKSGLEIEINQN